MFYVILPMPPSLLQSPMSPAGEKNWDTLRSAAGPCIILTHTLRGRSTWGDSWNNQSSLFRVRSTAIVSMYAEQLLKSVLPTPAEKRPGATPVLAAVLTEFCDLKVEKGVVHADKSSSSISLLRCILLLLVLLPARCNPPHAAGSSHFIGCIAGPTNPGLAA